MNIWKGDVQVKVCPECGTESYSNNKFCKNCGNSFYTKCPECGTAIEKPALFCSSCGANFQEENKEENKTEDEPVSLPKKIMTGVAETAIEALALLFLLDE